jgi:hypothetical protein
MTSREIVRRTLEFGGPDGGFVAGYYGDNVAIGLDPHWQDVVCCAFMHYGRYC